PKKQGKRLVERREIRLAMHEQAPQRRGDIRPAADANPFERADCVEQAGVMHVEPRRAKDPSEEQHVAGEEGTVAHVPGAAGRSARLRTASRRSPRMACMSS